jgi:hypothetical protein
MHKGAAPERSKSFNDWCTRHRLIQMTLRSGFFIESRNKMSPGSVLNKCRVNAGFIKGVKVLFIESQLVNQYPALIRQQRLCLNGIVIAENDFQVLFSKILCGVHGSASDGACKPTWMWDSIRRQFLDHAPILATRRPPQGGRHVRSG